MPRKFKIQNMNKDNQLIRSKQLNKLYYNQKHKNKKQKNKWNRIKKD